MEYKKENKKSKLPTSIRFNDTITAIALHKSGKESKQQLVDFLIDRFVNGENPVLERAMQEQYSESAKYQPLPASNYQQQPLPQQPLDKEGLYYQAISEAETLNDFKGLYKAIEAEKIPFQIKTRLYDFLSKEKIKKGFIYNDERD